MYTINADPYTQNVWHTLLLPLRPSFCHFLSSLTIASFILWRLNNSKMCGWFETKTGRWTGRISLIEVVCMRKGALSLLYNCQSERLKCQCVWFRHTDKKRGVSAEFLASLTLKLPLFNVVGFECMRVCVNVLEIIHFAVLWIKHT